MNSASSLPQDFARMKISVEDLDEPAPKTSPEPSSLTERLQAHTEKIQANLAPMVARVKVAKIGSMEINLTAIWEALTAPFAALWGLLMGGRSRRRTGAEATLQRFKILRFLAIGGFAGAIGGVLLFFIMFAWYSRELPQPGQIIRHEGFSTQFFDREGELLYDLFDSERRHPISIDQVPDHVKQATIAVEDKDFYKHGGFDVLTILRIPYNIIFRGRVVGGSTLTQQLVKNVLLTNERSIARKFKELVLSLQIERKFSKDQILEMYLNEAPYGGTAWGIGAAADIYFDKDISQVSLAEGAILAGLPQRPTAYSPFTGKTDENGEALWKVRAKGVLRRMKEDGYISDLKHEEALAELETVAFAKNETAVTAPHFVFYVRDQLEELFGEDVVERGGLKVTTTLDLELHKQAQTIVTEEIEKVKDLNITNGSAMVMDPRTGEILSMVGSRDYFSDEIDGQFNVAVDGLRQPGSSIKPVTYVTMFEQGYTPATMLMDVATTFAPRDNVDKPYEPKNYDGKFRGPVDIRNSLGSSLNIPAVKALAMVGVDSFLSQAYDMGFVTLEPTKENMSRFGLAVTLGGGEVHLIDTVSAYSAFANGGRKVEPVSILKVEDVDGTVLFEHKQVDGPQVVSPESAFLINSILSDNSARLMAFGANSLLNTGLPIAVKTGTTNDQRDNWTIGWSQEVLVGTWVGNNDNSPMKQVASGVTGASPIWRRIITAAMDAGYAAPKFEPPAGVEQVNVDAVSGYPSHDNFASKMEWVIKGTLPTTADPIHTKLKLCRGEEKLANEARVATGDYDEKEYFVFREDDPVSQDGRNRWQEGIDTWAAAQEDSRYKPPKEYCGGDSETFVSLKKPTHETKYADQDIEVEVEAGSGEGIEKIEIIANGEVKRTVNSSHFKDKINLPTGRYEVWAKAYSRGGQQRESSKVRIGTGGEDWKAPDPSPTPVPSPSPSPSPAASPSSPASPVLPSVVPSVSPGP